MRKLINILTIVLLGVLYSCSSKADYAPNEQLLLSIDTISVDLTLYNAQQKEVTTKAPLAIDESAISNLNIYVFNEQGALMSHKYAEGVTKLEDLVIYKGQKYTLYAVANAGKSLPCTKAEQVEALSLTISSIEELVDGVGAVLMSGKSSLVTLTDGSNIDIKLSRCISKFSLAFNYTELNSGVAITIKRAQLFNAPSSIKLFGENKAVGGNVLDGELYEQSHLGAFSSTNGSGVAAGSSLPFYLFENMQGTVASGSLTNKDKEQQMSSNAKSNSSYLELEYEYLSSTRKGTIVYRFYLGNTHADCNIERNTNYQCTVYFKGDGSANENSWSVDNKALVDLVTSVTLNPTTYKFEDLGATKQISATVLPLTANDKSLTWSSSNKSVATVSSTGVVTAVNDGTAVITATSNDGTNISATCNIEVDSKIYVTGVKVTPTTLSLYENESSTLSCEVLPLAATVKDVVWSSSNSKVATVDANGKVTAIAAGTADIKVASKDDASKSAICKVTVTSRVFKLKELTKTLYVGENFNITYEVSPTVLPTFASTSSSIATVDANGKVTAVAAGTTDIKVSAHGIDAICKVTVVQPIVEFSATKLVLYEGEVAEIPYSKLLPSTAAPTVTALNSSVVEIVSATTTGVKVKAKSAGITTITADLKGAKAQCTIEVQKLQIIINNNTAVTLYQGFNEEISYTVTPERAKNLAITWSSSNQSNVKQISGNKFQGGAANSSATITASFVDYPTVKSSVTANVKTAFAIAENNVSAYTQGALNYSSMHSRSVTISTHKDAKIIWSGNYVGSGDKEISISDKGVVIVGLDPKASGSVTVTGTVIADNGTSYSDSFTVDIYVCVKIKATYSIHKDENEFGDARFYYKINAYSNAAIGNRLSFTIEGFSLGSNNVSVNGVDTEIEFMPDDPGSFLPSLYPHEAIVIIEPGTEHDKSGADGKYRFYYSDHIL